MAFNLTLAQINPKLGDIDRNLELILSSWQRCDNVSHLVAFPELSVCGYPPEDLLLKKGFLKRCEEALDELVSASRELKSHAIVGLPIEQNGVFNACALLGQGRLRGLYFKRALPNYSVFDELRYFRKGKEAFSFSFGSFRIGVLICEDLWDREVFSSLVSQALDAIVVINASPFFEGKQSIRENLVRGLSKEFGLNIAYVNLVGGQDELVFDGRSFVFSMDGELIARAKAFEEDLLTVSIPEGKFRPAPMREFSLPIVPRRIEKNPEGDEELLGAIELSLRDYSLKNGFERVVIGVSGGIDSALVCAISCRVLGPQNVLGVFMPSLFTSKESKELSYELSKLCGFELREIEISSLYSEFLKLLDSQELSLAEENLQSRIRACLLYFISNKEGRLLLSTSNKSELAVGYSTIGGDMSGGFAPIKDLYKTRVYSLANYINSKQRMIPEGIISRPPSAELRPMQKDEDDLMPYETLDKILDRFLEDASLSEFDTDKVNKLLKMLKRAEFKRKQAPIGPKLTKVSFGKDWRMPITSGFERWI